MSDLSLFGRLDGMTTSFSLLRYVDLLLSKVYELVLIRSGWSYRIMYNRQRELQLWMG